MGSGLTVSDDHVLYVTDSYGGIEIYEVDTTTGVAMSTGVVVPSDSVDALAGTPHCRCTAGALPPPLWLGERARGEPPEPLLTHIEGASSWMRTPSWERT